MTAAELIAILQHQDPTTEVAIDTTGVPHGIFPVGEAWTEETVTGEEDGETYHCIVFDLVSWP